MIVQAWKLTKKTGSWINAAAGERGGSGGGAASAADCGVMRAERSREAPLHVPRGRHTDRKAIDAISPTDDTLDSWRAKPDELD